MHKRQNKEKESEWIKSKCAKNNEQNFFSFLNEKVENSAASSMDKQFHWPSPLYNEKCNTTKKWMNNQYIYLQCRILKKCTNIQNDSFCKGKCMSQSKCTNHYKVSLGQLAVRWYLLQEGNISDLKISSGKHTYITNVEKYYILL